MLVTVTFSLPWDLGQPVWSFAIGAEQSVWFFHRWDVHVTQLLPDLSRVLMPFWVDIRAAQADAWLANLCPEAQSDGDSHSLIVH